MIKIDPDKRRYIKSNYKFDIGDVIINLSDNDIKKYRKILGYDFCYLGGMDKYKTVEVVLVYGEFEPIGTVRLNKKDDIESLYKLYMKAKGDGK